MVAKTWSQTRWRRRRHLSNFHCQGLGQVYGIATELRVEHVKYIKLHVVDMIEFLQDSVPVFFRRRAQLADECVGDSIDPIPHGALEQSVPAHSELRIEAHCQDHEQRSQIEKQHAYGLEIEWEPHFH
jgi:hypothetical protein